jgi:hypothetical protein
VSNDYCILATLDNDDKEMNNADVIETLNEYPNIITAFGNSKTKIEAVNADIEKVPDWDILCLHSDDMFFIKHGFDMNIREAMQTHFPDTDGMLHFPDQVAGDKLCTYQIIGRKYYERTGYIYNPEYVSFFCDDEETEKAKLLGKYAFIDKKILEHRHPVWGFGKADSLLLGYNKFWNRDKRIFHRRKALNFGI